MSVIEVSEATFEADVLQRSFEAPVVVDFWAEWCAPCRSLGPILERLAAEANGEWTLAKLDVDSNPAISSAFRIQGIPAVKAFKDGRVVAEFVGALPEQQVRMWLDQLKPGPADLLAAEAMDAEDSGDLEGAAELFRKALAEDPGHEPARRGLARVELQLRAGEDVPEEFDPSDIDAVLARADRLTAAGRSEEAFELLIGFIRDHRDEDRERARAHLVSLFDALDPSDPRVGAARKKLTSVLF